MRNLPFNIPFKENTFKKLKKLIKKILDWVRRRKRQNPVDPSILTDVKNQSNLTDTNLAEKLNSADLDVAEKPKAEEKGKSNLTVSGSTENFDQIEKILEELFDKLGGFFEEEFKKLHNLFQKAFSQPEAKKGESPKQNEDSTDD